MADNREFSLDMKERLSLAARWGCVLFIKNVEVLTSSKRLEETLCYGIASSMCPESLADSFSLLSSCH